MFVFEFFLPIKQVSDGIRVHIFLSAFYSMSYFASDLDLVVEMLQVVIIYAIGPKYIPGYFRG